MKPAMDRQPARPQGKRDLTAGSLTGTLLRLAAPLALGMALAALYQMVDAFWLGKLDRAALAAVGTSGPLIFVVMGLAFGFGTAGTALVSQHTGAGRHREADRAAAQSILLLCCLASAMAVLIIILAPWLFRLLHVPEAVMPLAVPYLRVMMLGMPLLAFQIAYAGVLRALGDTVTPVRISAVANALNMVLDPVLIFGVGPFNGWGVTGAAVATVISHCVAAASIYEHMVRRRAGLHIARADWRPHWPILGRAARIGGPAAMSFASSSLGFIVFQGMINSLGTVVMSAFAVGFRVLHFLGVPGHAMAAAAAPVVGQALGAGKPRLARRAVWRSVRIVAAVMLLPVALMTWQGELIARAFTSDPDVITEAGKFFLVVPFSMYFFAMLMALTAAFYGSGHTRPVLAVTIVRWLIRLPVAWWLGFKITFEVGGYVRSLGLGLGSIGIYLAMVGANIICASLLLWLFFAGGWQSGVVAPATDNTATDEGGGQGSE